VIVPSYIQPDLRIPPTLIDYKSARHTDVS
jgi:hypothetical protein